MFGQSGPLGAELARPTVQNPGGGPQQMADPLTSDFQIITEGLKRFAARAKQIGDAPLSNELDQMANRLTRKQLKRKSAFDNANKQGAGAII